MRQYTLKDLWDSIVNHPGRILAEAFLAFSVLWTIADCVTYFIPAIRLQGKGPLGVVVLLSFAVALVRNWKPSEIALRVSNSNTTIKVIFGDIFAQDGLRAIPVNDFFDSKIGRPVSEISLHGLFLRKCFGGHPESFDKQIEEQLRGVENTIVEKVEGKKVRFAVGTTAVVAVDTDRYLAFALSKTDPKTCKANSDVNLMWIALHQLWQRARNESGGVPLNLPLVGGGLSSVGLPSRDLINLIILSAITETKSNQITRMIRIVLHRSVFDDFDLRDVKKHWSE